MIPVSVFAQLIIEVGEPLAVKLISMWGSGDAITAAKWDSMKADASVQAKDEAIAAMKLGGIDPTSPAALSILALIK
jgi:hypothetical protein